MIISRDNILNHIKKIIINTFQYPKLREDIDYQSNIVWDIGMNSIDYMRLISILEEEYGISLTLEDLNMDVSIGEFIEVFMKCLGESKL